MNNFKHLLGIGELDAEQIRTILDRAEDMRKVLDCGERLTTHVGKTLVTLFYENSTRTRVSFELAAKYMGMNVINIATATSSVQKGETLFDTAATLSAMNVDYIALRHPLSGAPHNITKVVNCSVINGGDGINEHPTQALLDALTMRRYFGKIDGLKVAIIGDIKHSRVAKSNLLLLKKLGASVFVYAPGTLMPTGFDRLGAIVCESLQQAIEGADVIMGLRIQSERQQTGAFPSLKEYGKYFGIRENILNLANKNAIVMHPGPVNRGVELSNGVIDGKSSLINEQVTNGVAVRMAVLDLLKGE